jgi:hypothetical protein
MPGAGLLVWHVDESKETNEDENQYLVALVQADASRDLENNVNRGDRGDPFPGWMSNTDFTSTSSPPSTGYSGQDSLVSVTGITDADGTITATASVHATGTPPPDTGDLEQRVASLEARVAALEDAVSRGGEALSALRQGAQGLRGGSHGGQHDGHHDGHRSYRERPGDVVNAGFAAAARAARELVSEVQQQWSPRRRT